MPLGRGHHRLGTRVREAHRPAQLPRGQREVRLHRQIELAPEPTADRRGLDPDAFLGQTQDRLELGPVHVRGLRRHLHLDPVADALGVSGLGFDVRVLDEAGLEDALDLDLRGRERAVQVAAPNVAADQDVAVARVVEPGRVGSLGVVERHHGRQLVPGHRERRHVQRRHRLRLADDHGDGLTPEPHLLVGFGEHRLIGGRGDHAEHVAAGDVGRGHDRDDPRRCGDERVQVAEPETGPVVRRAHDPDHERSFGRLVGAEHVRAVHLALAVDAPNAMTDGLADRWRRLDDLGRAGVHHGRDDLAVARAAAEDAAEPVHHLLLGGRRRDPQERRGRDQHARRADAALRGAVRQERRLQSAALAARVQSLERLHAPAREASHRRHARAHRLAVEQDRARAAVARVASHLGRREPEVVAQHVAQPPCRPVRPHRRSVHVERDRAHPSPPQLWSARRTSTAAARAGSPPSRGHRRSG